MRPARSMHVMIGSHLSVAGGMVNALHDARRLKLDCVQVFTANQRQWKPKAPGDADRTEWLAELRDIGWDATLIETPGRVVSHNSYLINLANPDQSQWKRSVDSQRQELERCESLHIPFCVMHPGAHLGQSRRPGDRNDLSATMTKDEVAGLNRIVKALDTIHRDLGGYRVKTCLETTVGSGTNLGYSFHQLAHIRSRLKSPERVGFCFDTCHVTAAGYDMSTDEGAKATLEHWDEVCGLGTLKVFHLNDSIGALGSRRDRHAHIGAGLCGRGCFRTILNHPAFDNVPMILETPKGVDKNGIEWDLINVRRLKRMIRRVALSR